MRAAPIRTAERNRRTWAASTSGSTASRPWLIASLTRSCIAVSARAAWVAQHHWPCGTASATACSLALGVGTAQLVLRGGIRVIGRPGVIDRDPGERAKDAHRFHRLGAAPGVHHEQGVLAGAGAVHPGPPALHPESCLVEPGHLAGRDVLPYLVQEPVQPPGRAGGQRRHCPGRARDAEQLGQGQRGAILRQELPGMQVDDDRGGPRPVLHRRLRARRRRAPGAVPAAALPLDQLVLGHLGAHRRQVEDLAAVHGGHRPRQPRPRSCRSSPARGGSPGPAGPPAPASSPYARPARRACGRSSSAATAASAPAWPAPHPTAASRSSARSASAVPEFSDLLPGLRQLRSRLLQRACRLREFPAQRYHHCGQHLIRRRPLITGHTPTLCAANAHRALPATACQLNPLNNAQPNRPDQLRTNNVKVTFRS